jgi:2-polyprenyl-3-methyl-5-hydroxy-6-metoxy-1,4-benzoquinol methylase
MNACVSVDDFVRRALSFKQRLDLAQSFDEIRELWRSTSLAYSYESTDPFCESYRAEVLRLYERLTNNSYNPVNELTSTKQSASAFEIGYPWVSGNLEVCAQELSKTVQALQAFHQLGLTGKKFIEFGAGWGNLAIPLAKAGQSISVVDIDEGFLQRIGRAAARENITIDLYGGDFVDAANTLKQKYDAVIFQSSFHHCLDFDILLKTIHRNILADSGYIFFLSEPIYRNFPFPWGLRFDGESLWAILCNQWLELGFEQAFFFNLMLRNGFMVSKIDSIPAFVGDAWVAAHGQAGLPFERWWLPEEYDDTFALRDGSAGFGRFCLERSILPGLRGGERRTYKLEFCNYAPKELEISISSGQDRVKFVLPGGQENSFEVDADCDQLVIESETYVPNEEWGNGDMRRVGVALKRVSLPTTV